MKRLFAWVLLFAGCCGAAPLGFCARPNGTPQVTAKDAEPEFPLTEDSLPHENVPKGEILKFLFEESAVFPGTSREVSVYVPRQYDGVTPACVYVNQDGVQWNAPVVFDNLIHKKQIPVVIGVFVKPGVMPALDEKNALSRFNRSLEYDGLGPDYSWFLLEELLPRIEGMTTSDGREILLSKNGNDRAIGGSSSGAICAFTAAWERPDAFSRVFSVVCTMVGLRGANEYPTLIRKYEPKPIRVFQQDGSNDNNIYGGDWWMANQELERALTFSGYEHEHVWGEGGHNGKHGTAVFPNAMRFLWKDWPAPVKAGQSKNVMLNEILIPGENWEVAWQVKSPVEKIAANHQGEVFFTDAFKTHRIDVNGRVEMMKREAMHAAGLDGRFFGALPSEQKVVSYGKDGVVRPIAEGIRGTSMVALSNGNLYVCENQTDKEQGNSIWLITPDGSKERVEFAASHWGGITVSTDQSLLYASDAGSHWVYSYLILPDGTLANKQRYYWLHAPDTADDSGSEGMQVDADGRLYVATRLGIQVCDQAGRVNVILPTPNGLSTDLAFGGADRTTLYVAAGNIVFKRKLKVKGVLSSAAPTKPAPPRL